MVLRRSCVLCGSKLNLHSFPKEPQLRRAWADAVGKDVSKLRQNVDKVCMKHFKDEQFRYNNRTTLKKDAIPSKEVCNRSYEGIVSEQEETFEEDTYIRRQCYICGHVKRKHFYCFPKVDIQLQENWAQFCNIEVAEINPDNHRLCDVHFEHDAPIKIPTKVPRLSTGFNNNETETFEDKWHGWPSSSTTESESMVPVAESFSPTKRYFRSFSEITEEDVVTPGAAILALRMAQAQIKKYRKKLHYSQIKNSRMKTKIEKLEDSILRNKELPSNEAMSDILVR